MTPELRLIRYFLAVGEAGNVTRAARRLNISQPSLSAAIKQLEAQLGVELLTRHGRRVTLTAAGALLTERGPELLLAADELARAVTNSEDAPSGRLRLGLSPAARFGIAPRLLAACAAKAPAVMLYTTEDTTGALLDDVANGKLDLAVTFCAPERRAESLSFVPLHSEPAVVHLPADHSLAERVSVHLSDLANETILVAATQESGGYTERILSAFAALGISPRTVPDPFPDLGLQAVRTGVGIVVYVRSAFPENLPGSVFVPVDAAPPLPFELVFRAGAGGAATRAVVEIAGEVGSGYVADANVSVAVWRSHAGSQTAGVQTCLAVLSPAKS